MQDNGEAVEIPALDGVNCHDHLCFLYEAEAEMLIPVIPFIQKGVAQGERCVYLNAGADALERVLRNALCGQKSDLGALNLLPVEETWLKGGAFDPGRVLELLKKIVAGSTRDGFRGTRIICEMGWAAGDAARMELLQEFELTLGSFAAQNQVTLLCLYRRCSFPAQRLLALAKIHRHLVLGARACPNPLCPPPDVASGASRAELDLDLFLATVQSLSSAADDRERLRQELEQAYAALARKIYENWQEEDTLRASEQELHEKDEALRAHRRRVQTVLQHLPAILVALDAAGTLTACNHEFERVTGFRAEEVMGKPLLELIQVEPEQNEQVLAAHPPQGGFYRGEQWGIRCKDGSLKSVSWSNISRYVQIAGWMNWIIGQDETPRIQAEMGMRSLRAELEARSGESETLGHLISRDLSGQLARIGRHLTALDLRLGALTPCREELTGMREAVGLMEERVAALKSLSGLALGGLESEEVDLSAMACEIV